ncbi:CRISPR-associated endonuclease Cas2 [uncultured Ilyobacter sp.]|uniref:CRISPR-associated endonuclease Cas2 n=1 Tax=uncultured Ilyobacter sp. TaxID=544433 RepID=UPI002AA70BF2|nr:CRISPR-associated endonuclease Cas2 [uncultured Ilyobacter sp.]
MLVWVIYDISKNKARRLVSDMALKYGLYRVQKSVFLGRINKNQLDELVVASEEFIDKKTDSVYVFPMCQEDFRSTILLGQAFDKKMVNDEIKSLFF